MFRKEYVMVLTFLTCGVGLLLPVAGCRKKPSVPPVEPTPIESTAAEPAPAEPPETSGTVVPPETAPTPPPTVEHEMQVVPLIGVGPVKFGMSGAQVVDVLGQPERTAGRGRVLYYLTSTGVRFSIDTRRGVQFIECWSAQHPRSSPGMVTFSGKTEKGIGMGASREEIVTAYGDPERVDEEIVSVRGDPKRTEVLLEELWYSQLGMTLVLAEGHLVELKVADHRLRPEP